MLPRHCFDSLDNETVPKTYLHSNDMRNELEGHNSEPDREESVQMLRGPGGSDTVTSRLTPLDQLIPDSIDSDTKMELILQARNQLFDGRYDATSVSALLATLLDEAVELRSLRERLFACLPEIFPSSAGRSLIRRNTGSCSRLAEDCWALGISAAQGMLTRFAETQTLRASCCADSPRCW